MCKTYPYSTHGGIFGALPIPSPSNERAGDWPKLCGTRGAVLCPSKRGRGPLIFFHLVTAVTDIQSAVPDNGDPIGAVQRCVRPSRWPSDRIPIDITCYNKCKCLAHRGHLAFDNLVDKDWRSSPGGNSNSFVAKTLPLTHVRSRLWQEILPKVLILIYRVGEGVPSSKPTTSSSRTKRFMLRRG